MKGIFFFFFIFIKKREKKTINVKLKKKKLLMELNLLNELNIVLTKYHALEEEIRNEARIKLIEFKENDSVSFIISLINILESSNSNELSRKTAAVFLYKEILPRDGPSQKQIIDLWFQFDISLHESLRSAANSALFYGSKELAQQSAQLLGLFYSIQFSKSQFIEQFEELLNICMNSNDLYIKWASLYVIQCFCLRTNELFPSCYNQLSYFSIIKSIFDLIIFILQNNDHEEIIKVSVNSLSQSAPLFIRNFNFEIPRNNLMNIINNYIINDNFFFLGYQILKSIVEYYYSYLEHVIELIYQITYQDISSDNFDRQIEACHIWQIIGNIEYKKPKLLDQSFNFSSKAFFDLFPILVTIISNADESDFEASLTIYKTPQYEAFSCLLDLSRATGEDTLSPIFDFVKININHEDWRYRYSSCLLLHCACKVSSFTSQIENILDAYGIFLELLQDIAPCVKEKAMWSLGEMIDDIPELVMDVDRFLLLINCLSTSIFISSPLLSRGCWLLSRCFSVFSPEVNDNVLIENFEFLGDLLLQAANTFIPDSLDPAYGALNKLIENTPISIPNSYLKLFSKVTLIMNHLIQSNNNKYITHHLIWICAITQALTMNIGNLIEPMADNLMQMLLTLLSYSNGDLTTEVLPAMGAVARAIKQQFQNYISPLIDYLLLLLTKVEFVQSVAIFIGDIYNALGDFNDELTNQFVLLLFNAFLFEDLPIGAKSALFSTLGDIAFTIQNKSIFWIDNLLFQLENQTKVLNQNDFSIFFGLLHCYQSLVPLLKQFDGGEKKIKSFFQLFTKLSTFNEIDGTIMYEVMSLIEIIAKNFGRKLNVMLNKPSVKKLIDIGRKSESINLAEIAELAYETVKSC